MAIFQKCPRLAFYSIFLKENTSFIGVKGSGYYGSIFHKKISERFFSAASDYGKNLYFKIADSIKNGHDAFFNFVKTDIFYELLRYEGKNYTSQQISALSRATNLWIDEMWKFFSEIPTLLKIPAEYMPLVFKKPEGLLQGEIKNLNVYGTQSTLKIIGRFDAILCNPDTKQTRLFEFKGYNKTDVTVPLCQTLIYAWLIYKLTGIIPEIEIIHLSENLPEINFFSSSDVRKMIQTSLPSLFREVCKIFFFREIPAEALYQNLCNSCKYKNSCFNDIKKFIAHKKGVSNFEKT